MLRTRPPAKSRGLAAWRRTVSCAAVFCSGLGPFHFAVRMIGTPYLPSSPFPSIMLPVDVSQQRTRGCVAPARRTPPAHGERETRATAMTDKLPALGPFREPFSRSLGPSRVRIVADSATDILPTHARALG